MKKFLIFIALTFLPISVFAQSNNSDDLLRQRFGVYFDFNVNFDNADFQKLPGVPNCCPRYETGTGTGPAIGLLYELPLNNSFLLSFRGGYFNYNSTLTKDEPTTIIYLNKAQPGTFRHTLVSNIATVGIEPMVSYKIWKSLFAHAGINMGYVVTKSYSQKEVIVGNGTYADSLGNDTKKSIRNEFSGELPNASALNFSGLLGLSYELPLNVKRTLFIVPEVFFNYGLMPVVQDLKWHINTLSGGLSFKWSPGKELPTKYEKKEIIDTVTVVSPLAESERIVIGIPVLATSVSQFNDYKLITETSKRTDTLLVPKSLALDADIFAYGVSHDGQEIANPTLRIEEFISNRLEPLLNYVFFSENSAVLPDKYIQLKETETKDFNDSKLINMETLPTYYNLLNIIGMRMNNFPDAKLRITGCNDGFSSEKNNSDLSNKRANTVADYLKNVWKIDESRLIVQARNLPENASTPISEPDKFEENRRVELSSDNYEILKPVYSADTVRTSNPPVIRFKPEIKAEAGLKKWSITVSQEQITLKKFEFDGNLKPVVDWRIEEEQTSVPRLQKPLDYSVSATDNKGKSINSRPKSLDLKQITIQKKRTERIADKEIDKYSLILFEFDKADIKGTNQRIINFIKERIKPNSKVTIAGYTDRTGDSDYDKKLSERRANATLKLLGTQNATANGIGKDELLYNNDIPEGRFFCRTVTIIVETPVEK